LNAGAGGPIYLGMDITTATFEKEVLETSKTTPVVVDFWAPWCGPCKALTPVLEKVAADYAGRVKFVKVNSDENQEIAAAFQIRSIPNVIAFKDGRAAAQFMGAVPESQVRAFFDKLLPSAAELALARAEADFAAGRMDEAEKELAGLQADSDTDARVAALTQGIAFARTGEAGPDEAELQARIGANPADYEARAALAARYAAGRRYREALEALLEIVRRAKSWRDGEARKEMVAIFNLAAGDPDLVSEYRRKLSAALY